MDKVNFLLQRKLQKRTFLEEDTAIMGTLGHETYPTYYIEEKEIF
jgi:hypothetical protein